MTDRYAVVGNPIKHSFSPKIHAAFAQAQHIEQAMTYEAIELPMDSFHEAAKELHEEQFKGLNVTVPFKEHAAEVCESISQRAEFAGAVNTLIRTATGWHGDNTDGAGLLRDLTNNLGLTLNDKRILLLGAGGAARGVIAPLLEQKPTLLHIVNRTGSKASKLAEQFASIGPITGGGFDSAERANYDLVINATSASLRGKLPEVDDAVVGPKTVCYDMMYASTPTRFVEWGQDRRAAQCVDGFGMLVEQAAESFQLWRGIRPETQEVLGLIQRD